MMREKALRRISLGYPLGRLLTNSILVVGPAPVNPPPEMGLIVSEPYDSRGLETHA
jgi:hypothetical protein